MTWNSRDVIEFCAHRLRALPGHISIIILPCNAAHFVNHIKISHLITNAVADVDQNTLIQREERIIAGALGVRFMRNLVYMLSILEGGGTVSSAESDQIGAQGPIDNCNTLSVEDLMDFQF